MRYAPPADHVLDVELVPAAELRQRVARVEGRGVERVDFHCLIFVAGGHYEHTVDFEIHSCRAGSCLVIQPGQVHEFGAPTDWTGWMLIFRSELLAPRTEILATHTRVTGRMAEAVDETLARMSKDAAEVGDERARNALLRTEVEAVLMRLRLAEDTIAAHRPDDVVLERFRRFRSAVDREFAQHHAVSYYADLLGCSTKSLNRATREVAGVGAKAFVIERLVLEAKRLLAHTNLPVATIGARLGFDEPTNFVKFFRRVTSTTPGRFRSLG
ncbi:MAG: AraC family transcriptional regulator [Acidimicrobiales bacterium]|nr:MAG: AraC family transcriptional regulator [Acidimicrobiales bacterium]